MRLNRGQFMSWLKSKQPSEVVGENRDCHSCPIAKFYSEICGCEIVIFQNGWGDYIVDRGYSKKKLPAWGSDFVFTIDGDSDGKITAYRALEVLASR